MMFTNPWPSFQDENGDPLSGGRLSFFEAGTTTPKIVYADHLLATPMGDFVLLDSQGIPDNEAGIHLGAGEYDVLLESVMPNSLPLEYVPERTYPNYKGHGVGGSGLTLATTTVANIEALREVATTFDLVRVLNYYDSGDRGGRIMQANHFSSESDNGGTIIAPTGSPDGFRWTWLPDSEAVVDAQLFGIIPSTGDILVASQITAMDQWVDSSTFNHIRFSQAGDYYVDGTVSLTSEVLELCSGIRFKASTGSHTFTVSSDKFINHGEGELCYESAVQPIVHLEIPTGEVRSEWWGNNTHGVQQCLLGSTGNIRVSGTSSIDTTTDFTGRKTIFEEGATLDTTTTSMVLTLDQVTSESTLPIFTGELMPRVLMKTVKSSWYEWYGFSVGVFEIDATKLGQIINQQSVSGTEDFTFHLDRVGLYNVGSDYINTSAYNCHWKVEPECELRARASLIMGSLTAGDYPVISKSSYGYTLIIPHDQKAVWYGCKISNTDNYANLGMAFSCIQRATGEGHNAWLDLGGNYTVQKVIDMGSTGLDVGTCFVKNGTITNTSSTTEATLAVEGDFEGENFHIYNTGQKGLEVRGDNCTLRASSIEAETVPLSIAGEGKLEAKGTYFSTSTAVTDFLTFNGEAEIEDCRFNGGGLVSLTYGDDTHSCNSQFQTAELAVSGRGSVKDCRFTSSSIYSLNPEYTYITGNTFTTSTSYDAGIYFLTDQTGFVTKGLICKGNIFSDEGHGRSAYTAIDKGVINGGTWADTGHLAEVFDNSSYNDTYRLGTTRFTGLLSDSSWATAGQSVGVYNLASSDQKWLFNYSGYPERAVFGQGVTDGGFGGFANIVYSMYGGTYLPDMELVVDFEVATANSHLSYIVDSSTLSKSVYIAL